ncbi:hypothetical protein AB0883_18240 [Micromonospora sp. NPDC047812]
MVMDHGWIVTPGVSQPEVLDPLEVDQINAYSTEACPPDSW